jgi:hypothetical protein
VFYALDKVDRRNAHPAPLKIVRLLLEVHVEIDAGNVAANLRSGLNLALGDLDIAGAELPLLSFNHRHRVIGAEAIHAAGKESSVSSTIRKTVGKSGMKTRRHASRAV